MSRLTDILDHIDAYAHQLVSLVEMEFDAPEERDACLRFARDVLSDRIKRTDEHAELTAVITSTLYTRWRSRLNKSDDRPILETEGGPASEVEGGGEPGNPPADPIPDASPMGSVVPSRLPTPPWEQWLESVGVDLATCPPAVVDALKKGGPAYDLLKAVHDVGRQVRQTETQVVELVSSFRGTGP